MRDKIDIENIKLMEGLFKKFKKYGINFILILLMIKYKK